MNAKQILHIAVHRGWANATHGDDLNLNAGDTCLNPLIRMHLDRVSGPWDWKMMQLWEYLSPEDIKRMQDTLAGIVIGGGGMLLCEQPGTDLSLSGWTWNCPMETLEAIEVPCMMYAVGYNRFRGHPEFSERFTEHINLLASKCTFIGMRNWGSVNALKRYIKDPENQAKIKLNPCPTTVEWQLCDNIRQMAVEQDKRDTRILGLNVAFDRPHLRFGPDPEKPLTALAKAMAHADKSGWSIRLMCHKRLDLQFQDYLDAQNVTYETWDLSPYSPKGILQAHAEIDLAVGLRGHAQMIPFGLRKPIISVVTHDKMNFFLEDINHPEWGVEILDQAFYDKLCALTDDVLNNLERYRREVADAQENVWGLCQENHQALATAFN